MVILAMEGNQAVGGKGGEGLAVDFRLDKVFSPLVFYRHI